MDLSLYSCVLFMQAHGVLRSLFALSLDDLSVETQQQVSILYT